MENQSDKPTYTEEQLTEANKLASGCLNSSELYRDAYLETIKEDHPELLGLVKEIVDKQKVESIGKPLSNIIGNVLSGMKVYKLDSGDAISKAIQDILSINTDAVTQASVNKIIARKLDKRINRLTKLITKAIKTKNKINQLRMKLERLDNAIRRTTKTGRFEHGGVISSVHNIVG